MYRVVPESPWGETARVLPRQGATPNDSPASRQSVSRKRLLQKRILALGGVCMVVVLSTTSCWRGRKSRIFIPPPVYSKAAPLPPPPVLLTPDPSIIAKVTDQMPPVARPFPPIPEPPAPPPPRRPATASAPKPVPPTTAESAPPMLLGQIFSEEQKREYNRQIDENLDRVKKALVVIEQKKLSKEDAQVAETVRSIQKQAEQAREQDLVTAVNLARRADLLAKDLIGRLP